LPPIGNPADGRRTRERGSLSDRPGALARRVELRFGYLKSLALPSGWSTDRAVGWRPSSRGSWPLFHRAFDNASESRESWLCTDLCGAEFAQIPSSVTRVVVHLMPRDASDDRRRSLNELANSPSKVPSVKTNASEAQASKALIYKRNFGAAGRIRTHDPLVRS